MSRRLLREHPRGRSRNVPLLLLVASLTSLAGCAGDEAGGDAEAGPPPPAVEALPARSGRLPGRNRVSGVVRARNQVEVRGEIAAPIVSVLVESGEAVSRGQVLARLSDDELRERRTQAEASVRLAEAQEAEARAEEAETRGEAERVSRLAEASIVSMLEADTWKARAQAAAARTRQAEARTQQARAELQEARAALARAVVRAPVAGRVDRRAAEVGQLATPGTVLFVVGDPSRLVIEVPLTEDALARVQAGGAVLIRPRGAEGEGLRARLTRISPFLRPGSFSTVGEIELDNAEGRLRPGNFVTVDLLHGDDAIFTLLPAAAAWEDPRSGAATVWVLRDDAGLAPERRELSEGTHAIERREVMVLGEGDGRFGVDGVREGEWVVTVGQHLLQDADQGDPEGADGVAEARVRPAGWERVLEQQSLQREDLLRRFLEKQRRLAAELGSRIPPDPETAEEILRNSGRVEN